MSWRRASSISAPSCTGCVTVTSSRAGSAHPPRSLNSLSSRAATSIDEPAGAFSGKVDTGFPQKMRPNKKVKGVSMCGRAKLPEDVSEIKLDLKIDWDKLGDYRPKWN